MDIMGLFEIAQLAGVSTQAVWNWTSRHDDFPQPVAVLKCGPIYAGPAVRAWLAAHIR